MKKNATMTTAAAFTIVELVAIILIIGILSVTVISRLNTVKKIDTATQQIMRHIRYTQHLAMLDDPYRTHAGAVENPTVPDANDNKIIYASNTRRMAAAYWFKRHWMMRFGKENSEIGYSIFKPKPVETGRIRNLIISQTEEVAIDTLTGLRLTNESAYRNLEESVNLAKTYSISDVKIASCPTASKAILFDTVGRPHKPFDDDKSSSFNPYEGENLKPITKKCLITIIDTANDERYICMEPYTGYISRVETASECS